MRTFAIVAVAEGAAPDLFEWLAFHRAVGVRHVVIYDDGLDPAAVALLRAQAAIGVTLLPRPARVDCPPRQAAYEHFLASQARLFRFSAFIGTDEFLVPPPGRTLDGWLARIPPHAGSVVVNRRVFDTTSEAAASDLVLRRFPRGLAEDPTVRSVDRQGAIATIRDGHLADLVQGERLMSDFSLAEADPEHPGAVLSARYGEIRLNHYPRPSPAASAETEACPRTESWIAPTLQEMRHVLVFVEGVAPAVAAQLRARYAAVPDLAQPVSPQAHRRWRLHHLHRPRMEAAGRFVRRRIFGAPRPW